MRRSFQYALEQTVYAGLWPEGDILELRWKCPFCAEPHTVFIPESWITEGKAVFVEEVE